MTTVSVLVGPAARPGVESLICRLHEAGLVLRERLLPGADVVLCLGTPDPQSADLLLAAGLRGTPVLAVGACLGPLYEAAGVRACSTTARHEIRLRPGPAAGELTARLPGPLVVTDVLPLLESAADDVEVLLTANVALREVPVATWRPGTGIALLTVGSCPTTYTDPQWQRLVHRLLRRLAGEYDADPVRIGLLGYGAIGHEHSTAIAATEGLQLAAVCDTNPARVASAQAAVAGLRGYGTGEELLADDGVDLVVVSTPPNTHADWALRALSAGRSVVVEKPFCLTVEQADRQITAAAERGLTLAVYQNRRWDPDYLALKQAVRGGRLGDVFHYESFVGGYDHPCNYWHSDEAVSGGAIYDWGSHYLDWALDLFPGQVEWVSATAHKRRWYDVTNADHTRVLLHFADGTEAEFSHSDLAAARKPKWYVLGTEGALVGQWREASVLARSPIGTLVEDRLAVSDSPAELMLHTPDGAGGTSRTRLSVPAAPPQPFHRELADQMLSGWPMSITPAGSRRNIAVMQAATASAASGGRPAGLPE